MRRILLLAVVLTGCESERQVVAITDSLTIPAGREIVLRAPEPLRTPNLGQSGEICWALRPPLLQDTIEIAIRTPDGRVHVPSVALVRPDGAVRTLTSPSYLGEMFCLGFIGPGEPAPPYVAVRMRSDVPLSLGKMTWLSTDK